ncbi:MAG: redoxin domain-containing protein, partial [Planctomycetes bacterium]|nr:redoxin domain-containing protein [Planctomycetota bacterium]
MVKTASTMLPLGTLAPDFKLPNVDGSIVSLNDVADGKALVVVFMCNHCPFVKHIAEELVRLSKD